MVAIDPALTLLYRDEYRDILKAERGNFKVLLAHEWLIEQIKAGVLDNCKKAKETDRLAVAFIRPLHRNHRTSYLKQRVATDLRPFW